MTQKLKTIQLFSENILHHFWLDDNVLVWNLKESCVCFVGYELLVFKEDTFNETPRLNKLCDALLSFKRIILFFFINSIKEKRLKNTEIYRSIKNIT